MNAFAGINAAVRAMNPNAERVYGEESYFEEVMFIGKNRSTKDVLANKDIASVDLYVSEFNHNINISTEHSHYTEGEIIRDVEALLKEKPGTKHLTVALDVTIDFINSDKVKKVLTHFAKEIQEGKLNFVFFRSGQKFDMLGMDNYYGASYWTVNNGGEQWKGFDSMMRSETYKTDPLTRQWFSLVNKYAPAALDTYRGRIFENAKAILKEVPKELLPGASKDQQIRVSTVDKNMEPAFIDIKILNDHPEKTMEFLHKKLYERFAKAGVKMHSRGSFGFYHPNFNVIPAKEDLKPRNIRINPGLNPEDNKIIVAFLKDIPKLMVEFEASRKAVSKK